MSNRKLNKEELIILSAIAATQIQSGQDIDNLCMELLDKYVETYNVFNMYNRKIIDKEIEEEQIKIKEVLERREKNNS